MIIGYITGQSLKIQAPVVVSDSINYLTAQFFFQTEDWQGLTKWAHFKQGENVYDFALENDRIEKDAHLNLSDGEWEIYLHGNEFADGEVVERITTEIVKLTVKKSGVLEGEPFAEQPASEVERLNAKLEKILESGIGGAVTSVNGRDGDVVLTAEDVGALPADTKIPTIPTNVSVFANDAKYQTEADVTNVKNALSAEIAKKQDPIKKYVSEVNGKTGNVTLTPNDVGALPADADVVSSAELQSGLNAKQDVIDRFAKSVNGMSGDVVLSASDVKALPESTVIPTVPKNVSEFQNDADYATRTFVQETVNGKNLAFVFDSVADLDTWLSDSENVSRLKTGDVFWIRDTEVPDYWWDGENQTKQIMETTKVDLSAYALKTEIPVKTSELQNDSDFATNAGVDTKLGGYQPKLSEFVQTVNGKSGAVNLTASDVGALPSATQIPVVPTNVSAFANDAKYATESTVNAGLATKQNTLTFDSTPTAGSQNPVTSDGVRAAIDAAENTYIFELVVSLSASGITLSLPEGVTYEIINEAVNSKAHVICTAEIPSVAGADMVGAYALPFTKRLASGSLFFSTTIASALMYAWLGVDNSLSFDYYSIERQSNKVTSISEFSTNIQYPTAKAVYDYVANASNNGFTVIDLSAEADLDGVIYPDEATEAKIAEVIASVSPAAIRWHGSLLFYYVGLDVFVTSVHYPEGHVNHKLTYQKDQHILVFSPFL